MGQRLVLSGGRLASGQKMDVAIDQAKGCIVEIGTIQLQSSDKLEDCRNMVILPAPVELHAHLDKALLNQILPIDVNPTGDLAGAIFAMQAIDLSPHNVFDRAKQAVIAMIQNGTTTIRSHVDVRDPIGTSSLKALIQLSSWLSATQLGTLQLACLMGRQLTGREGATNRALLTESLELGVDVVGGCPYLDDSPQKALSILLDAAAEAHLPVDLHTDETLDANTLTLTDLLDEVERRGIGSGVNASHCVSLSMQTEKVQSEIAMRLAESGVSVTVLPQTNLYLQARGMSQGPPRGIAPAKLLKDAGVNVVAGADNVQDPFCPLGRLDALETASLLILAAHFEPEVAWQACSNSPRKVLGLPEITFAIGDPANLLVVSGNDVRSALSQANSDRIAIHGARVVSRTKVSTILDPDVDLSSARYTA